MLYLATLMTDALLGSFKEQMMLDEWHLKMLLITRTWVHVCCVIILLTILSFTTGVIAEVLVHGRGLQIGFVTMVCALIIELIYHQWKS